MRDPATRVTVLASDHVMRLELPGVVSVPLLYRPPQSLLTLLPCEKDPVRRYHLLNQKAGPH